MHTYIHTCIHTYVHTCIRTYIHTYIHTYVHKGKRISLVGGQLSVPSRCTAVYTWLLTAGVASGHGNPALLRWVDSVSGNLGLPLMVGLGSTETVRCWQACPVLANLAEKQAWEQVVALYLSWLSCSDPPYMFFRL